MQLSVSFVLIMISWLKHEELDSSIIFLLCVIVLGLITCFGLSIYYANIVFAWFSTVSFTSTLLYSSSTFEVKSVFFAAIICFTSLCDKLFEQPKESEESKE